MNTRTATDPLVRAITEGTLTPGQRAALADVIQVALRQAAAAAAEEPALCEDRTSLDATRWQRVASALRANRVHLYPGPCEGAGS